MAQDFLAAPPPRLTQLGQITLGSDPAVARLHDAEEAVRQQARGGKAEQHRAVRRLGELPERAVEADRLLRLVLPGGTDEKGAGEAENDAPRQVTHDAEPRVPATLVGAHLPLLQLLAKVACQRAIDVEDAGADDREADRDHEVAAERLLERDPRRPILLVAAAASAAHLLVGAEHDSGAHHAQPAVEKAPCNGSDPLEHGHVLVALELLSQDRLGEAPERVGAEADGHRRQQEPAEGLRGQLLQRARSILDLAAPAEGHLERR